MWTEVIVALISSITTLAALFITNYLKHKNAKKRSLNHRIQRDVVVYEILNSIKTKFKFSRVVIILFHNGSKYFSGEPIQKASVVFETVSPGIDPIGKSMQDIPVSTMTVALKAISSEGWFLIDDIEKIDDEHYKNLMKSYRETQHYSYKIEDVDGWIGILTCDYTVENSQPPLTRECAEYIRLQAGRLATLLKLTNKIYGVHKNE
ncbi:MAG TPA: hypothetical protein PKN48_00925 [Bacteroidales bacterium]|nr:hypothetical protein [Bacteroidales bacterium]